MAEGAIDRATNTEIANILRVLPDATPGTNEQLINMLNAKISDRLQ